MKESKRETYGEDVDYSDNAGDDSRGDHALPHRFTQALLGRGLFVQVAEDGHPEDNHEDSQCDESMSWGEEWPVGCYVPAKDADLSDNQRD